MVAPLLALALLASPKAVCPPPSSPPVFDLDAVAAPDGRHVAFIRRVGRASYLYVAGSDGSGERVLAQEPEYSRLWPTLTWSPNGREIAFIAPNKSSVPEIRVVNRLAGAPRVVFRATSSTELIGRLTWSADDRTLAFFLSPKSGGPAEIAALDVRTRARRVLAGVPNASVTGLAWSPDGGRIAYSIYVPGVRGGPGDRDEVWVARADGSGPVLLGTGQQPAWSPDSKRLAVVEGFTGLAIVSVHGGERITIPGYARLYDPTWSPAGDWIAFTVRPFNKWSRIGVARADGTGMRWLGPSRTDADWGAYRPSWLSPGELVASVDSGFLFGYFAELHVLRLAGDERRLTYHCIRGARGADTWIRGTAFDDVMVGVSDVDRFLGGPGNDALYGERGDDVLFGGEGNDVLIGGPGRDQLYGDAGNDLLRARDGQPDLVSCGGGRDVAIVDGRDSVRGCERVLRR